MLANSYQFCILFIIRDLFVGVKKFVSSNFFFCWCESRSFYFLFFFKFPTYLIMSGKNSKSAAVPLSRQKDPVEVDKADFDSEILSYAGSVEKDGRVIIWTEEKINSTINEVEEFYAPPMEVKKGRHGITK